MAELTVLIAVAILAVLSKTVRGIIIFILMIPVYIVVFILGFFGLWRDR